MSGLQAAIDDYHELLARGDLAAESSAWLDEQQRRQGLLFAGKPLCTVLRPRFLDAARYDHLRARLRPLLHALATVHGRALADLAFRRQLRLADWEETLLESDPGFRAASPLSRMDAFFQGGYYGGDPLDFRLTEYNAETPAGALYGDALSEVFLGMPVMREYVRRHDVRTLPAAHNVLHSLLRAYHEWSGRRELPRIGILDWREVLTWAEFGLSADYFRAQGLECVIADPREVEYRGGRLIADGVEIDLVYKRVLIHELIERGGMDHPIVRAVLEGAVCMVNPFRCKILHKKASLAVLSDEANADLFSAEQQAAIAALVPWTRVVEARTTTYAGRRVDLLEHLEAARDRLVLKPNDDYGGKGIVLGWQADADTWRGAITTALAEPYVVQERIAIPSEPYPAMVDGSLVIADRIEDTAPFVFDGDLVDSLLSRLSTESLVNVTAGGGSSLPSMVVAQERQ